MTTRDKMVRVLAALALAGTAVAGCSGTADDGSGSDTEVPQATLDGTYTLKLGALSSPGTGTDEWGPDPIEVTMSIRSTCLGECVASALMMDPPPELSTSSFELDFIDGRWVSVGKHLATCGDQETVEFKTLSLEPRDNDELAGIYRSLTASNNGCNADRPATLTRIGDLDPAVTIPDPATMPARVVNRASGLNGEYRMQFTDNATGEQHPEITRRVHTYCMRSGIDCVTLMTSENHVLTWVFNQGKWTYSMNTPDKCPDGRATVDHDSAEFGLPSPAADPIPSLTGVRHQSTDAPCAAKSEHTVTAERIGD